MGYKIIVLQLIAFAFIHNLEVIDSITIKTKSGQINGITVNYNNKVINQFVGIPYAEPPVGSNRFGVTKPVHQWNSTYDATHFKNSCVQKSSTHKMSEDCLFLNVYSEEQNGSNTKLRPVMVWIHGGGFHGGDGYELNGTILATYGVVVASLNYRLGPFGFLYGGDPSAPGNVGILDQIMALKWINDNIESFGGDPKEITVFGESAGSWSVSVLLVSPLSKNLFKRAIMQSGAYYFKHFRNSDKSTHLDTSKKMAVSLGCHNDSQWLDCMRNISAETINSHNIVEPALTYEDDAGVLPISVEEALRNGKVNTGVELIAGITKNEALGWAVSAFSKIRNISNHITKTEFKDKIQSMYKTNATFAQEVYDYYISPISESNQTALRTAFVAIFSDTIMICPTYYFAKEYTQTSASDLKTYFYELTYKNKNSGCKEDWMGVCHGDDIPFIFGEPIIHKSKYSEMDYEFSLMFHQIWTNFAKTGNPLSNSVTNKSGKEVKTWPYFIEQKSGSVTSNVMELNPTNFGNIFVNQFHNNCDVLLRPYFK